MPAQGRITDMKDDITWEYVSTGIRNGEKITNEGSCGIGAINACGGDFEKWKQSVISMLESLGIEILVINFEVVEK
jgi:hypothetical protein